MPKENKRVLYLAIEFNNSEDLKRKLEIFVKENSQDINSSLNACGYCFDNEISFDYDYDIYPNDEEETVSLCSLMGW